MAIALDYLDELFELMLCQVFTVRRRHSSAGVERRAIVRISVVGVTSARYAFVIDLWAFRRATIQ